MIALVDCDMFFVSCERLFNPKLHNRAVVVLSNNDGCVIARSKEAKALGIPMGAPFFQFKALFETQKVIVLSSNFSLYGDISQRIIHILESVSPSVQVYSVDEAFVLLESDDPISEALAIRKKIADWVGVPVSIGIGKTKTLAKAASDIAKKSSQGVFFLSETDDSLFSELPVEDIWGIGRKTAEKLHRNSIFSGEQFRKLPDDWLRKNLTVTGLRLAWELRGVSCLPLEETEEKKKSITYSRSFGTPLAEFDHIAEALSTYAAKAARKLRGQNSLAGSLEVFLHTSFHKDSYYINRACARLSEKTNYTPLIISEAKKALEHIYRPGLLFKKTGIILYDFCDQDNTPQDFFEKQGDSLKKKNLMSLIDTINNTRKKNTLRFAAEAQDSYWKAKKENQSPRFTTSWEELPLIRI